MNHVVLLGDSIFDNARYVPGGPSVIEHLRRILLDSWRATLLAVDGAVVDQIDRQLQKLPADASLLAVSMGGNNALDHSNVLLNEPAEALPLLGDIHKQFQKDYRAMLERILELGKPTMVCTIYDSIPILDRLEYTGLCLFNDVILREAFRVGIPVIDLRLICNEATDYAQSSPIEPSVVGGRKIAVAIARALVEDGSQFCGSRVIC